jgi:hypothetical protein
MSEYIGEPVNYSKDGWYRNNELIRQGTTFREWNALVAERDEKHKEAEYLGMKANLYEEQIIQALEYAQQVIERCESPNPMIHKSTMIQDFKKVLELLGQHTGDISP